MKGEKKGRYQGVEVVDALERVMSIYGLPKSIRVENEPELFSKDLDLWVWGMGVTIDFSRPGKPIGNAFVELFNGTVWAECINQNCFMTLDYARSSCEAYLGEYNEDRPHSSIGKKISQEFMNSIGQSNAHWPMNWEVPLSAGPTLWACSNAPDFNLSGGPLS